MREAPIQVLVYFVIRNGKCELATDKKLEADQFIETFNRLRTSEMQEPILKSVPISI